MLLKTKTIRWHKISLLQFRMPVKIIQVRHFQSGDYPVCPRCQCSMEREYTAYCSNCGQRLDWTEYIMEDVSDTNLN